MNSRAAVLLSHRTDICTALRCSARRGARAHYAITIWRAVRSSRIHTAHGPIYIRAPPVARADFGTAFSMSAMAYDDDLLGGRTGQERSIASPVRNEPPPAADTPFLRPGPEDLSEAIPVFFIGS